MFRFFSVLIVLSVMWACGVKGPPLPPETQPVPTPTPAAKR